MHSTTVTSWGSGVRWSVAPAQGAASPTAPGLRHRGHRHPVSPCSSPAARACAAERPDAADWWSAFYARVDSCGLPSVVPTLNDDAAGDNGSVEWYTYRHGERYFAPSSPLARHDSGGAGGGSDRGRHGHGDGHHGSEGDATTNVVCTPVFARGEPEPRRRPNQLSSKSSSSSSSLEAQEEEEEIAGAARGSGEWLPVCCRVYLCV